MKIQNNSYIPKVERTNAIYRDKKKKTKEEKFIEALEEVKKKKKDFNEKS